MSRRLISSGSPFEKTYGYSRAVAQGPFCFVAGTTGYDAATQSFPEGVEAQTRTALRTIEKALADAGFGLKDIVRATYYVTDIAFPDRVNPILGEVFGDIRPAATMVVVTALVRPEMKIEIEVTAYKG